MTLFVRTRSRIRHLVAAHELAIIRIWRGILIFACILLLNKYFGYLDILKQPWVAVLLPIGCAFMPLSGGMFIICVMLLLHLTKISLQVTIITLALLLLAYFVTTFYQSKRQYHIGFMPLTYQLGIPFVTPMESALMGEIKDISSVLCGGVLSFFLGQVRENASEFAAEDSDASAIRILLSDVIGNKLFYFYIAALAVMYLSIYLVKFLKIKYSWFFAIVAGVVSETLIMLGGYLTTDVSSRIPTLIGGNVVVLLLGVILTLFFRDLDYTRVENVQFEDDEYYYYVTAVPKIRIAEEEKRVKKITGSQEN
ncbi:MAG: hypothetical protein K6A69_01360 [Lachnospiraceae bacterium]|nr:hypothetical protein [Lachnospiraceae bacterium]